MSKPKTGNDKRYSSFLVYFSQNIIQPHKSQLFFRSLFQRHVKPANYSTDEVGNKTINSPTLKKTLKCLLAGQSRTQSALNFLSFLYSATLSAIDMLQVEKDILMNQSSNRKEEEDDDDDFELIDDEEINSIPKQGDVIDQIKNMFSTTKPRTVRAALKDDAA